MWAIIGLICIFGLLLTAAIVFARKNGKQAARLEALKAEAKERQRKNEIIDRVRNMPADDVYSRLSDTNRD
ncbi:MAG: hypothetical protein IKB61_02130 [Elusimicrobiaceae bacterium]|nr:hypothetical protein [Elusimicrobiaceae bacterium]